MSETIAFTAELRGLRTMVDSTVSVALNLPEPELAAAAELLKWGTGCEVEVTLRLVERSVTVRE